jgi:hypothetical protein
VTFKKGQSGNPAGMRKGTVNKRSQLAKLFEPHAPDLIAKAVELAKGGDVQALRLCLDKIIPKAEHSPIDIELPEEINLANISETKGTILRAVIDGKISIGDAERLVMLISSQIGMSPASLPTMPTDPTEAANVYRRFMQES